MDVSRYFSGYLATDKPKTNFLDVGMRSPFMTFLASSDY